MTEEQKQAARDFAQRLIRIIELEYGWPGSITVIQRELAEFLDDGR